MEDNEKLDKTNKPRFRIGGPDELMVLLWARGDEPKDIAEKFKVSLTEVEDAIRKHGHQYKRRRARRSRAT